jgi:hypothetical protein
MTPTHDPVPATSAAAGDRAPPRQYISEAAIDLLQQTRPWVMVIAILAFISAGFMVLAGLGVVVAGTAMAFLAPAANDLPFPMALIGLIYLPFGALYFFGGRHLYRYAKSIRDLRDTHSTTALEDALSHQKSFWKLSALTIIGMLGAYALAIFVAVLASVGAALMF